MKIKDHTGDKPITDGVKTANTIYLGNETFGSTEITNAVIAAIGCTSKPVPDIVKDCLCTLYGEEIAKQIIAKADQIPSAKLPQATTETNQSLHEYWQEEPSETPN